MFGCGLSEEAVNNVIQAKTRGGTPTGVSGDDGPVQRGTFADTKTLKNIDYGVMIYYVLFSGVND